MKRHLGIILALSMVFTCLLGTTAFAAEPESINNVSTIKSSDNTVVPYGSLSGYGQHWYNSGEKTKDSFYVNVSGNKWSYAQLTVSIDNFGPDDMVAVKVYRPDNTFAWGTLDNAGDYITMANRDKWHNIMFNDGQVGTYRVEYSIINKNGHTPGSGRINCWIY